MAFAFPEGASFQFSTTFASAKTISDISNASPAVATATAHGYADGDLVLIASGWDDVNDSVVKVNQLAADTFELLGVNTSETGRYPVGTGGGTAKKISGWQVIPQVLTIASQGGDSRYTQVQLLSRRNAIQIPTGFNSSSIQLSLAYDPGNAVFEEMLDVSRGSTQCAFRMVLSGGVTTVGYGYMAVSEMPQLNSNQVATIAVTMTLGGRPISYSA